MINSQICINVDVTEELEVPAEERPHTTVTPERLNEVRQELFPEIVQEDNQNVFEFFSAQ